VRGTHSVLSPFFSFVLGFEEFAVLAALAFASLAALSF